MKEKGKLIESPQSHKDHDACLVCGKPTTKALCDECYGSEQDMGLLPKRRKSFKTSDLSEACRIAAKMAKNPYLKDALVRSAEILSDLKAISQETQWISVEERLPELTHEWEDSGTIFRESVPVLVQTADKYLDKTICRVAQFEGKSWSEMGGDILKVTHWKYLGEGEHPVPAPLPKNLHGWRTICTSCGCAPNDKSCSFNCVCHGGHPEPAKGGNNG